MMRRMRSPAIVVLNCLALILVAACGGGGSSAPAPSTPTPTPPPGGIAYTPGTYPASSTFAAQCQTPRTGNDPATGRAFPDRAGSTIAENHWLRSWTQELYLWYREVPDLNPANTATTAAYFDLMKTTATLASGQAKDRYHFTYDTARYQQLAGSGIAVGYGIDWVVQQSAPPRRIMVQFVEPGSPATAAGLTRGVELLRADGVDVVTGSDVTTIYNALSPANSGESHQFVFRDRGSTNTRTVTLVAAAITSNPVPVTAVLPTTTGNLGYLLFNDHNAPSEAALIDAIITLRNANVRDLVLDLRYNGGGYLAIASQLSYMIAGAATTNRTFERLQFNDKYPTTNPVTGQTLSPTPFYSTTVGLSRPSGQALPTLNLPRVYVLTSGGTCSASESLMNGLRGIGIAVYQFGPDTCGKPYGFYPQDNCGTTYFSIQFKGVNAAGFGDYFEGFSATRANIDPGARLPGCAATDDLTRDLGNPDEERMRVARVYRDTGLCTGTAPLLEPEAAPAEPGQSIELPTPAPWRMNRILR
jgi:carboxyl-terminal processing protease